MLDWLHFINPSDNISLETIRKDSHAYRVPDYEEVPDIESTIDKYLKANYGGIFLNELSPWYTDPEMFPQITYPLFLTWFEISYHSMVFDTINKPITKKNQSSVFSYRGSIWKELI